MPPASPSPLLLDLLSRRRLSDSYRSLSFIPTSLALISTIFILFYISLTSNLFHHPYQTTILLKSSQHFPKFSPQEIHHESLQIPSQNTYITVPNTSLHNLNNVRQGPDNHGSEGIATHISSIGNNINNEVFHDKDIFTEDYKEMNRSFKIFVYPHKKDDPFANALLPVDFEPGGNYASESYFKKVLMQSHFITKDPEAANLFFLPFSIARLRHDSRINVEGVPNFIRMYISYISQNYPYWNRSGGSDHFYVACHSTGRSAMEKAAEVKFNAIQVVCSSSYFLSGYVAHKDASLPQIWPRKGEPPQISSLKRKKLAFFAGSVNSPVREKLLQTWKNDTEISVYSGRLTTPYSDYLLGSKFCLHVKGFEVNTARVADALYYGCVPIIIANHYDLPFADILNWKSFSVVIATLDIPLLKKTLREISSDEYTILQQNVINVRQHFQWHLSPVDYDAFYMVMYELWIRHSAIRIPVNVFSGPVHERNISNCV